MSTFKGISPPDGQSSTMNHKKPHDGLDHRALLLKRRGRLVIRNLPFNLGEEQIRAAFSKFGELTDFNLLRKPDGSSKGLCFLSFKSRNIACKAVKEMNAKNLGGRVIAVDHSLPKKIYQSSQESPGPEEEIVDSLVKKTLEKEKGVQKEDGKGVADNSQEMMSDDENEANDKHHGKDDENNEDDGDEDYEDDEGDRSSIATSNTSSKAKQRKRSSRDAREGRTIFLRNLSYDTTKDDLQSFMERFGPVEYCLLCCDFELDRPKGTGFVKFKSKEDAEKCLKEFANERDKFFLNDRQIELCLALTRGAVKEVVESKNRKPRDRRNLYLAKEGLIYPESPAAEGLSQSDLAKRLQCELNKRRQLNNLTSFVSRNRLCIHNLPETINDKKLKKLFLDILDDKSAIITEAKVIKNFKGKGKELGKSSGFGFVTFKKHVHALTALRRLNNNPETFTPTKRPIVEFSIEKTSAIRKKLKNDDRHYMEDRSDDKIEDEDLPFMGVKASPFKDNEQIILPKVNRKIYENFAKLKERGKQLKKERKKSMKKGRTQRKQNLKRV
ncbi:RNA-binding protein 28 [Brevipalpus obovatus]|uniref:RNA-binding protein 28 n=1 Tax=Brevipalpus obovatus TaxID=246614 RepID=UPI003D9F2A3C